MIPPRLSFAPDPAWHEMSRAGTLGPTHGSVLVEPDGRVLCTSDGPRCLLFFRGDATLESFLAPGFSGIHDLKPARVDGADRWLACHLAGNRVMLLGRNGRPVWTLGAPIESGHYRHAAEFKPTAAVLAPDGSLYVADGYGASVIHHFAPDRRYLRSFGGEEAGAGQLRNCHGLALDTRGAEPRLLVCDRRNRRLVHFTLDGAFAGVLAENLRRPCSVAFHVHLLAVAELEGRVTILDDNHQPVATLGDNPDPSRWAHYEIPRGDWAPDRFNAPHSVAFDAAGNLFVQEWNRTGRLTRWLRTNATP
jgi:hypothetical protein